MSEVEINVRRLGALASGPAAFVDFGGRHERYFPLVAFHAVMVWHEHYGRFLTEGDWLQINRQYHLRRPTGPGRHLTAWMLQTILG